MTTDGATPFHDLDAYVALPRLAGLTLSPDGSRLVTAVQTLDPKRTRYVTALWEVDPTGGVPARRLTRSAKGESSAVFASNGDLLFTSARPDADDADDDDARPALWLLPEGGGEARVVATAPGGVGGVSVARDASTVSVGASLLPSSTDLDDDAKRRKARKDHKVAAILHDGYPVRYWDHDLGPDRPHRFVADLASLTDEVPGALVPAPSSGVKDDDAARAGAAPEGARLELRDLTPTPGAALEDADGVLSPDGRTLVTTWRVTGPGPTMRSTLVAIDTATGDRYVLVDDKGADVFGPTVSPDGRFVAYVRETVTTPHRAPEVTLAVVPLAPKQSPRSLTTHWDRWPTSVTWLPDGSGLLVTADDDGRGPVFHVAATGGGIVPVERVTAGDAVYTDVRVARDGSAFYALRSSYLAPAEPVRVDLAEFLAEDEGSRTPVEPTLLRGPVPAPALPGTLVEVETPASDDVRVRAWLALPKGASAENPAPLALWVHGGPLGSWNTWSWRWNPWLMVAAGYAVLLPDPALSTGYGQDFVQRGWGAWGDKPFTDVMAVTDAVVARDDVDETRTGMMGGSFGGYMANWIAGHTDRFRAIVTHASLWALDQFGPTTDASFYWERELSPEAAVENSPHRFVGDIRTPMLVVHGDKDYRVPVGEGLRLWYELLSKSGLPADAHGKTVHRFLYFPDENHWVLTPEHAKVWYQVVLAFLAEHVLGVAPDDDAHPGLPSVLG